MAQVFACEFPDDFWFDVDKDVWIFPLPSGVLRLGMTDPAQTRSGRILHVRAKAGKTVKEGKNVATIESAKWVGPFPAPFEGSIIRVNEKVSADPNIINRDPYGEGWIVEFRAGTSWPSPHLIKGVDVAPFYRNKLKDEGITCIRCEPVDSDSPERFNDAF